MSRLWVSFTIIACVAFASGCKKHSSSCKPADLAASWTPLALPTGEGDGRVCSSTDAKTDVEHLSGNEADWEKKYEAALLAQGYTKDRCTNLSCSYLKDTDKINVHANEVGKGKTRKTIVHLTRSDAKPRR